MKVELKVNDTLVFASDTPTTTEWHWQEKHITLVRYLERLAKTEAIPEPYRQHITAYLKCQEDGSLPPPYPGTT